MASTTASNDETIEKLDTRIFWSTLLTSLFLFSAVIVAITFVGPVLGQSSRFLPRVLVAIVFFAGVSSTVTQAAKAISLIFQRALLAHDLHKD